MTSFTLSCGKPADADAIAEIERQCLCDCWSASQIRASLASAVTGCRMARAGKDTIVGYILWRAAAHEAEIHKIAVLATCRRRGLARRLIAACFEATLSHGVSTVHLEVRQSNFAARALYAATGFVECGCRPRYYADTGEDAILMRATRELDVPPGA
jgi:ribosomal-protein-alanine N-acetyltransferase